MASTLPATPTHRDGPLAFVDDLDAPVLDRDDHHHLARVLRVRDGSPMVVGDGAGRWRRARFAEAPTDLGDIVEVPSPAPPVTVGFAPAKGDRPELVVQKLTELGVDRIVPFTSDHTVVRWDAAKAEKQRVRFVRIAREASMQCRRVHLPVVEPCTTFAELAARTPAPVMADVEGEPILDVVAAGGGLPDVVLVGPEGGWSTTERAAGLSVVRLGTHVLRAETAAITAAALVTALRSREAG